MKIEKKAKISKLLDYIEQEEIEGKMIWFLKKGDITGGELIKKLDFKEKVDIGE